MSDVRRDYADVGGHQETEHLQKKAHAGKVTLDWIAMAELFLRRAVEFPDDGRGGLRPSRHRIEQHAGVLADRLVKLGL